MMNDSGYNSLEVNNGMANTNAYLKLHEEALGVDGINFHDDRFENPKEETNNRGCDRYTNYNNRSLAFNDHIGSTTIKTEPFVNGSDVYDSSNNSDVYGTPIIQPAPFEEKAFKNPSKSLKFHCTYCTKVFAKKQQLQNHTKTHTKEKKFCCETCQKSFIHKQQLANHQKTHTGNKDFSCSFCAKCFTLKQQLQIHEKIHTGEKNFGCNMCEKSFITKQQLQNHVNSHLGIKPFTCNECHKKFAHKQQLERHVKNHGLKQNYACVECEGKFLTKTSFNEHLKEVHLHMEQSHNKLNHGAEIFNEFPS